jgi:streptomycin 6-kinase
VDIAGPVFLHTDLHDENMLAGDREPWLAIDPSRLWATQRSRWLRCSGTAGTKPSRRPTSAPIYGWRADVVAGLDRGRVAG